MRQAIGNRAGEAATLHQLASLDMQEGHDAAAREKFDQALRINQDVGNRPGEAAIFMQLGNLTYNIGNHSASVRFWAIRCLINAAIGYGDAEVESRLLSRVSTWLGFDATQLDVMMDEARQEYERDRGRALIERAFARMDGPPDP